MSLFRRSKRPAAVKPDIVSTSIAPLADILSLPIHVRSSIGPDEQLMCLASIDSSGRKYTLLLDLDWVALAVEVDLQPDDLIDDLPLPRAAMRAVINGWSTDQPFDDPAPRWSDDGIPHVGFSPSDIVGLPAIE